MLRHLCENIFDRLKGHENWGMKDVDKYWKKVGKALLTEKLYDPKYLKQKNK